MEERVKVKASVHLIFHAHFRSLLPVRAFTARHRQTGVAVAPVDPANPSMNMFLQNLIIPLLWVGVFYTPLFIVVLWVKRAKDDYEAEAQEPFTDLPLRLPGESTRKAAEEHWEKASDSLLLLIAVSGLFGFAAAQTAGKQPPLGTAVFGVIVLINTLVAGPRLVKSLRRYWDCQLGFKGERVVAEELNQLLSQGWRIFHDVPFDGFNVDHVAVGPVGVFAVETKAKRKWKDRAKAHPAHMVIWDGKLLTWPSGVKNDFGIEQADRNAKTVREFLSKATGEPVSCQSVLTLPGWWIETKGRGSVIVAATKGLSKVLPKCGDATISPQQMQRIAYQLEQRCRPDNRAA